MKSSSTLTLKPSGPKKTPATWGTLRLASPLASPTAAGPSATSSAEVGSSAAQSQPAAFASFDEAISSRPTNSKPLEYEGSFEQYEYEESTPVIGRVYASDLQLADLLKAADSNKLIKDLAVLVARRGVVFFRAQSLTAVEMTKLGLALGRLSGGPAASGLHVHPLTDDSPELPQVAEISSTKQAKGGGLRGVYDDRSQYASEAWHSDITFEKVPSSFAMLKINTLPKTGGDTLWASAAAAYEKLSLAMAAMLEGLTATHDGNLFHGEAGRLGISVRETARGHPENAGPDLSAEHPVIRTNPITGWKSLFVNKAFTKRINGVTKDESDFLLKYCTDLVTQNHDLQVRFKWQKGDVALWHNASTHHSATYDYGSAKRAGERVCVLGERPYFDSASLSRREALAAENKE